MFKKSCLLLICVAISILCGCEDKFNTSHPDEGGIALTMDWPEAAAAIPSTYYARVIFPTGFTRDFDNLSGTDNLLVVDPGKITLYVYNIAEHISISSQGKAKVNNVAGGIANPGSFFSYAGKVSTERDMDVRHIAVMKHQTGEIRFTFAIKPADIIGKVRTINATLEGVASELDMLTNELTGSSSVPVTLSKSTYYATATIRLLGFDVATRQNLTLDIELENGRNVNVTTDLASLVGDFNNSRNTPLALNAELFIPNENSSVVTLDKWERNTELRYLSAFPLEIDFADMVSTEIINVFTDRQSWEYNIATDGNWLTATQSDNQLEIEAKANSTGRQRTATITISAEGLNETVTITQQPQSSTYYDQEVVKLQSATVGKGVNIILMGDGYTIKDMNRGTGKYEQDMRAAADHFFSIYPYTEYRHYFNVYMITAISNEEGISIKSPKTNVDTKFETLWEGGRSTGIDCNDDVVVDYLNAIPALDDAYIDDLTVIMPINSTIYAGTCYMYHTSGNYGNGFSIGMCPVSSYFKEIVTHEVGGHGFSKAMDEYIYYGDETIPDEDKKTINSYKDYGWCENVDFYSDISQTTWKGFANQSKYNMVSTFEGSYTYGKGIWRPENNSCMNDNTPYYNAPTRWAIVRRIMRLAGFNYSFSQFLQDDKVPAYPTTTRRAADKEFTPLSPPVIKNLKAVRTKR